MNILALTHTGSTLGSKMVILRIIAAVLMVFIVGRVISIFFGEEKQEAVPPQDELGGVPRNVSLKQYGSLPRKA